MHPDASYDLVDTERGLLVLATERRDASLSTYKLTGVPIAQTSGKALALIRFRHPFYDRDSPVYVGDYVTLDTGTGIVHSSPAYGIEDFVSCKAHGLTDDQILNPVQGDGVFAQSLPLFGGMKIWDANREDRRHDSRARQSATRREADAQLHALLAASNTDHLSGHFAWFAGMDVVPSEGTATCANSRLRH